MITSTQTSRLFRVVGKQVRERRKLLGVTQDALARRTGISRSSLANLERGVQRAPLPHLYAIAEALSVDITELLPTKADLPRPEKVTVVVGDMRRVVAPEIAELVKTLLTARFRR